MDPGILLGMFVHPGRRWDCCRHCCSGSLGTACGGVDPRREPRLAGLRSPTNRR